MIKIENKGTLARIEIYGDVVEGSAKQFSADLKPFEGKALEIRINSSGGSVYEGLAIFNSITRHKGSKTIFIDGCALSMASVIAMAGDKVFAAENALLMIHNPWSMAVGDSEEMRKTANIMDKTKNSLVQAYVKKTKKSAEEISKLMDAETWMDADEALAAGFIDAIDEVNIEMAAHVDLSKFKNVPLKIQQLFEHEDLPMEAKDTEILNLESKRRNEIKAIFSLHKDKYRDLQDTCLDDFQCSTNKARELLLTKIGEGCEPLMSNPIMDTSFSRNDEFKNAAVDSLLLRNGVHVEKPHPAATDLSRMSVIEMAATCLSQQGVSTKGMRASRILNAAITHSTSDFAFLLADSAGKSLQVGYGQEPGSHEIWVKKVSANDFKTMSRIARSEAPQLLEVPENEEYTHGTFSEAQEQYNILTYGRMFSISRQALINDDLGAFTTLPQSFGSSAKRLEADKVYSILTDNANMTDGFALFSVEHKNLAAAGSALSLASLSAARAKMRGQKGLSGLAILNIIPRYLIVPAALESEAEQLIASLVDPAKSNDTPNLEFIRNLILVVDARLDVTSATAWFLAGNFAQIDTIEMAHLDGRGIDYEEKMGWNIDGLSVKARLDFGTKSIDWKGLYSDLGA